MDHGGRYRVLVIVIIIGIILVLVSAPAFCLQENER